MRAGRAVHSDKNPHSNKCLYTLKSPVLPVGIYSHSNIGLNIFDYHARDLCGRSYPQGACVVLEVSSLNALVYYFQSTHNNHAFELQGVKINAVQNIIVHQNNTCQSTEFYLSCTVPLYALCYSTIIFFLFSFLVSNFFINDDDVCLLIHWSLMTIYTFNS